VSDKEKTIYSDDDDNTTTNNNNTTNEEEESKKEEVRFVITFFVTGDRANAMAKIDPNERIEMAFQPIRLDYDAHHKRRRRWKKRIRSNTRKALENVRDESVVRG